MTLICSRFLEHRILPSESAHNRTKWCDLNSSETLIRNLASRHPTRNTSYIHTKMSDESFHSAEGSPVKPIQSAKSKKNIVGDCDIDKRARESYNALRLSYAKARKTGESKWLSHLDSCFVYLYKGGGEPSNNLAAFDLDGTIIKPKSNKRIPKSATDWDFFSVWTKIKLQQVLRENKARFVVFTNQNGVGLKIVELDEVKERIELVTNRLGIPCTTFMAIEKDSFRKPEIGMFKLYEECFNDVLPVDLGKSFYCGDAIGYPSHSDADIKFAKTLRLPFLPPDKFVRGVKPKLVSDEL